MLEPSFIKTVLAMGGGDLYHYGKKAIGKLLEPEKQYSSDDYQIITTLRLLYRDTFGATAELPIQLKFRHELEVSPGAKIEPPPDDVYRPPGLLPERYSLTLFPLGDGLLSDFCRMGISEIMLYLNERAARMFGGGHKNDARAQVLNLLMQPLKALSAMDLDHPSTLKEAQKYIAFLKKMKNNSHLFPSGCSAVLRKDEGSTMQGTIVRVLAVYEYIETIVQNVLKQKDARAHFKTTVVQTLDLSAKGFLYLSRVASSKPVAETVTLTSVAWIHKADEKLTQIPSHLRPFHVHDLDATSLSRHLGALADTICQNVSVLENSTYVLSPFTTSEGEKEEKEEHKGESKFSQRTEGLPTTRSASSAMARASVEASSVLPSATLAPPASIFGYDEATQTWVGQLPGKLLIDVGSGIYEPFRQHKKFMWHFVKLGGLFEKLGEAMGLATRLTHIAGDGGSALTYLGLGVQVEEMLAIYTALLEDIQTSYRQLESIAKAEQTRIQQLGRKGSSAEKIWLANYNWVANLLDGNGLLEVAHALKRTLSAIQNDYQEWRTIPRTKLEKMAKDWMSLIVDVDTLGRSLTPFQLTHYRYDPSKIRDPHTLRKLAQMFYAYAGAAHIPELQREMQSGVVTHGMTSRDEKGTVLVEESKRSPKDPDAKPLKEEKGKLPADIQTRHKAPLTWIEDSAATALTEDQKESKALSQSALFSAKSTAKELQVIVNHSAPELRGLSAADGKIAEKQLGAGPISAHCKTIEITRHIDREAAFIRAPHNSRLLARAEEALQNLVSAFQEKDSIFASAEGNRISRQFRLALMERMIANVSKHLAAKDELTEADKHFLHQHILQLIIYLKTQRFGILSCFFRKGTSTFNVAIAEKTKRLLDLKKSIDITPFSKERKSSPTSQKASFAREPLSAIDSLTASTSTSPVSLVRATPRELAVTATTHDHPLGKRFGQALVVAAKHITPPAGAALPTVTHPDTDTQQKYLSSKLTLIQQAVKKMEAIMNDCFPSNKMDVEKLCIKEASMMLDLSVLTTLVEFFDSPCDATFSHFIERMDRFYRAVPLSDRDRFEDMKNLIDLMQEKFPAKEVATSAETSMMTAKP